MFLLAVLCCVFTQHASLAYPCDGLPTRSFDCHMEFQLTDSEWMKAPKISKRGRRVSLKTTERLASDCWPPEEVTVTREAVFDGNGASKAVVPFSLSAQGSGCFQPTTIEATFKGGYDEDYECDINSIEVNNLVDVNFDSSGILQNCFEVLQYCPSEGDVGSSGDDELTLYANLSVKVWCDIGGNGSQVDMTFESDLDYVSC